MCPDWGRTNPHATLKRVVLPAPLGPITPTTSPESTATDTPSSAVSPPKATVTSFRDIPPVATEGKLTQGSGGISRFCRLRGLSLEGSGSRPPLREVPAQDAHPQPQRRGAGKSQENPGQNRVPSDDVPLAGGGEQRRGDHEGGDQDAGGHPVGELLRPPHQGRLVEAFEAEGQPAFREGSEHLVEASR